MLVGATGTGKELLADAYAVTWCGERSLNAKDDFGKLNCTAFSDELLHAALFGVVRERSQGQTKTEMGSSTAIVSFASMTLHRREI